MLSAEQLDLEQVRRMALSWHMFATWLCADCADLSDECVGCTLNALADALEQANELNAAAARREACRVRP